MTFEGRKKLYESDPVRFAAYADEFKKPAKPEVSQKPLSKKANK